MQRTTMKDRVSWIWYLCHLLRKYIHIKYWMYHHLNKYHDNDLENVMKYMKMSNNFEVCKSSNCHYSDRKYRVNETKLNEINVNDQSRHGLNQMWCIIKLRKFRCKYFKKYNSKYQLLRFEYM